MKRALLLCTAIVCLCSCGTGDAITRAAGTSVTGINNAALRATGRPVPGEGPSVVFTESGAHWSEEWVWEGDHEREEDEDSSEVNEDGPTSAQ